MRLRKYGTECPKDDAAKLLRRGVVLLAALLLVCTLMAGAVSAENVQVTTYEDLKSNLEAGHDVTLMADLTFGYNDTINVTHIPDGKTPTLNLNEHSISATQNQTTATKNNPGLFVIGSTKGANTASLTVKGQGSITTDRESGKTDAYSTIFFIISGSLNLEGSGTYEAKAGFVAGTNGVTSKDAKISLNGGTYKSSDDVVFYLPGENTQFTLSTGAIIGENGGVEIRSGIFTMNGGSITAKGKQINPPTTPTTGASTKANAAIAMTWNKSYSEPTKIYINGGTVKSENNAAILNCVGIGDSQSSSSDYVIRISDSAVIDGKTAAILNINGAKAITPTITGGTFIVHTFDDLKTCLEAGANVKLGAGITKTDHKDKPDRIGITSKTPTLDLNGKTLDVTANTGEQTLIKINGTETNPGSLTVKDTTSGGKIAMNGEKPYIFFTSKYGNLVIDSGTFESAGCVVSGNGNYENGVAQHDHPGTVINGGTLTSDTTAIYMTGPGGTLTINGGTITGVNSAIEMRAGTATINGGTVKATGSSSGIAAPSVTSYPVADGSAIVLLSTSAYQGTPSLTIGNNAVITSSQEAAIRNYVRSGDARGGTASVTVTIGGSAKLEGTTAAIENAHYTGDTESTIVGTFTLNGGYYKVTSGSTILVGIQDPKYPSGYSMTKQADESGYHFVTKVVEPTISEKVETKEDGKTTISAASEGTLNYDEATKTVTMKDENSGVTLAVIYDDAKKEGNSVSGTVNSITATYEDVDLDEGHAVSLEIALDGDNPAEVTAQLPSIIKSVKVDIVKTSLSADYNNVQILTMFEALSSDLGKFNDAIKDKGIVITFKIPATAVGSNPVFSIAHFTANGDIKGILNPDSVVKDGDYWIIKVTATEFSGYAPFTGTAKSSGYSSSGNMNNAFRVLFDTAGGSYISPATGLSYGDKISQPANPVKDGYTFGGWYKDAACTQGWSFSDSIPGDMTLYAKWTSSGTAATATQTAQTTTKATTAPAATQAQSGTTATTAAPVATTAAGAQPTLTQAPAPVLGGLFGLLAAGILLRRKN